MQLFKRKKIKLSLIDDYVKIMLIFNFCNNSFDNCVFSSTNEEFKKLKNFNLKLKYAYEIILNKLKMNNLSLLILKKELKNNNSIYLKVLKNNFNNFDQTLFSLNKLMNMIHDNLSTKLKLLKIKSVLVFNNLRIN